MTKKTPTKMRVLVGGSFACDAALATPLALLLRDAVRGLEKAAVEWLGYGTAADLVTLEEPLRQSLPVELVLLLVRLSDLQAAHPELILQPATAEDRTAAGVSLTEDLFLEQLKSYDEKVHSPPLLIQFCPSPPALQSRFESEEAVLWNSIRQLKRVHCRPSSDLLRGFTSEAVAQPDTWYDALQDKREHAPYTQSMLNALALSCVRGIARLVHQPKKVVVLDCDNTLWGGAVADVGPGRVELSARFLALQRFVVSLQQRGMLLCLCSKNIAQDVDAVFKERASELVLQLDSHIVSRKVNWRAKSENIREIASELALHLDSFVFIDDNALECHEVASALPMVSVIHLPDDFDEHFLDSQWVFDTPLASAATSAGTTTTAEDAERTKMYQQNAQRSQLQRQAPSQAAFLSSLGIRIQFERVVDTRLNSIAFARVLQLHQRTNTFNVATTFSRGLTLEALAQYMAAADTHFVLTSTVTDRYGHYGLVCVALFRLVGRTVTADSFLMSCRALNRGAEHAMMRKIAEYAQSLDAKQIEVAWEPTVRNEPVRVFFATLSCSQFIPLEGDDQTPITSRREKLRVSAVGKGVWRMATNDALSISFLKDGEEASAEVLPTSVAVVTWRQHVQTFAGRMWAAAVRFLVSWKPLTWVFRLVLWVFRRQKRLTAASDGANGLLKTSLHSRELLDAFVAERFVPQAKSATTASDNTTQEDEETDELFRLRARHQTKLLLLDHVAADAPRVVWAPQRSDDVRLTVDGEEPDDRPAQPDQENATEGLQQFHRPCATPSCETPVYWESACSFERCRTCCYRVQRLLARATSPAVHAKARAHAKQSLQDDFNVAVDEDTGPKDDWCTTHQNARRRK